MKFPWNFLLKAKFDKNSPFWAEGCILGQNSRKLTPLKIPFYFQGNITLPNNTFFIAWQWHQFDFGVIFTLFCFLNWLFAENFSNCSNSLNFEAKINCNTSKLNVPKCKKTCTELILDLLQFYGPQSHILFFDHFEGPCGCRCWQAVSMLYVRCYWLTNRLTTLGYISMLRRQHMKHQVYGRTGYWWTTWILLYIVGIWIILNKL